MAQKSTVVVFTDRHDWDDPLCGIFARGWDLLRESPRQTTRRADLRR